MVVGIEVLPVGVVVLNGQDGRVAVVPERAVVAVPRSPPADDLRPGSCNSRRSAGRVSAEQLAREFGRR